MKTVTASAGICLRQELFDGLARRAVEIAMDLRPFQKLARIAHRLEATLRDEAIMDAVDLARAPGPRRHRDGQRQVESAILQQHAGQRRLAGAGGRRQDQHDAVTFGFFRRH
jgi:hypothetical protein